jgi:hypothetical protein
MEITQQVFPTSVSPIPSVVSSATVRPGAQGIVYKALNCIHEVLDAIEAQTDNLHNGQALTNQFLDNLCQCCL